MVEKMLQGAVIIGSVTGVVTLACVAAVVVHLVAVDILDRWNGCIACYRARR